MHELIIIGAGPAGIAAAVYAARKRLDFLVITDDIGGQAAWSGDIENYIGYQFITGTDLAAKFEEHVTQYGIPVREGEPVRAVERHTTGVVVRTGKGEYLAKALIIASGKRSRQLDVPGEKEFRNKGVAYCATCDAPLFSGKRVAVIGGGNSALEAVLQLVKIAEHVTIVNNTASLGGDAIMREKVLAAQNVSVLNEAVVTRIGGGVFVERIGVRHDGGEKELPVRGVFIEVGLIPNADFVQILEKNAQGEIVVNAQNETSVPGIFAAGDVTTVPEKQIIIAAGDGAKAALRSFTYLMKQR